MISYLLGIHKHAARLAIQKNLRFKICMNTLTPCQHISPLPAPEWSWQSCTGDIDPQWRIAYITSEFRALVYYTVKIRIVLNIEINRIIVIIAKQWYICLHRNSREIHKNHALIIICELESSILYSDLILKAVPGSPRSNMSCDI